MKTTELFYPQILVSAGAYSFNKGIEIEVHSSKDAYYDWAKVKFTQQFQQKISFARKDPAVLRLGYNGTFEEVFKGFVAQPYNVSYYADEISLKDDTILLEETTINNTFLDTTPQEVIAYFLSQAGIARSKLSPQAYPPRKQLAIQRMNVIDAINTVHAAWAVKQPFFFSGGVFYWGEKPEQDTVYQFEYGVNILKLSRSGSVWELETVSAPFVKHSHKILVVHPKITGVFEVSKVTFITNDEGFIRTYISFYSNLKKD